MSPRNKGRGRGRPRKGASPGGPAQVRAKLVRAAIDMVREEGARAVTTTALAKRAGISQSGFYQYFANVDDCLGAAAVSFADEMRVALRAIREQFFSHVGLFDGSDITERLRTAFEHSLRYAVEQPHLLELVAMFRRFRGDVSAFGVALQEVDAQVIEDMVGELYTSGQPIGLSEQDRPALNVYARISLSLWEAGVELLLSRPEIDRDLLVDQLAHSQQALLRANVPTRKRRQITLVRL